MKIKTRTLPYETVAALPRPKHRAPRRPNPLFTTLVRLLAIPDLIASRFTCKKERMEAAGDGPWLILMNHSSFIDLKIASRLLYPKPYCIVCTTDALIGKRFIMRNLGCIPTQKYVTDITLVRDMLHALKNLKTSVLMYPEAGYTLDGCATKLPQKLGVLLKKFAVPVVFIETKGAFLRDPLYNCLQKRRVRVSATMRCLLSKEEIESLTADEIDQCLAEAFAFDGFRDQKESGTLVKEPFRADGLERILYKCASCGAEGQMVGKGVKLTCGACGKSYTMTELGELSADDGETKFSHIPDWYRYERECVKAELDAGAYRLDTAVDIVMLVDHKSLYRVGEGRLIHDETGFTLTGCDGALTYTQSPDASHSLNTDYYWYEMGDVIGIGDRNALYYCFPKDNTPVAKARLAAEELYRRRRQSMRKL